MRLPSAVGQDWHLRPAGPLEPARRPRAPCDGPSPFGESAGRLSVRTTPVAQLAPSALPGSKDALDQDTQPAPVHRSNSLAALPVGRGPDGGAPPLLDVGGGSFPPGRRSSGNCTRHRTHCRRERGGPPARTRCALHLRRHGPHFDTPAYFNDLARLIRHCIRLTALNPCLPPGFF